MKNTLLFSLIFLVISCDAATTTVGVDEDPKDEEETYFSYGEYGGSSLVDKEDIYNITYSNDGEQVAFIRQRTPNDLSEPIRQLWIADKDGRNPEFIAAGPLTIDWSDDDTKIVITQSLGAGYSFVFILDLEKRTAEQLTGSEDDFFHSYTTVNPQWIDGQSKLLFNVWSKAHQQTYDRGVYIYDLNTTESDGVYVDNLQSAFLGNNGKYFTSFYWVDTSSDIEKSYVIYNFENNTTQEILPDLPGSDFKINWTSPNPLGTEIILTIRRDYADQLVLTSSQLENFEQITEFGGHNPRWRPDGKLVFLRDVHKGDGAHNVPYLYDPATSEISRLWEDLPEFVPEFPPVSSFNPISIYVDW